jgi:hypothetical protein
MTYDQISDKIPPTAGEYNGDFSGDCLKFLEERGVPEQYRQRVYQRAWDEGHAYGYNEVLSHLDGLADIFRP